MRQTLFTITLLLWATSSVMAQAPQLLSLEEALHRALWANPAIEAAHFREESARQQERAAKGLRLPQIGIIGNYTLLDKDISLDANHLKRPLQNIFSNLVSTGLEAGAITPSLASMLQNGLGTLTNASWQFSLQNRSFGTIGGVASVPIFTGGRINAAIKASHLNKTIVQQQALQTEYSIITKLIEQYFSLALSAKLIEVRTEALDGIKRHLHDAIALENEGLIPRSEKLYAEYRKAEAEGDLQAAILEHKSINDALRTTMADSTGRYTPTTPMFTLREIPSIDVFQSSAQLFNPLLSQATMAKELAEEGVRVQRADYFPQIAAIGATNIYNHRLSRLVPRWAIGLSINIKLFDGLSREHRYAAARSDLRSAESLALLVRNDLTSLINGLYNRLLDAHNRIASLSTSITFAEAYLHDKEIAFREGLTSATDLIDAELNLSKARIERLKAVCTYDITLATLLEISGQSHKFTDYASSDEALPINFNDN